MVRLILFDIDGTLIRTGGAGVKAFAEVFRMEFGASDGFERLKFAGRTDISLVREFFGFHNIPPSPENFERFFREYVECLKGIITDSKTEVCQGIHDFISAAKEMPEPPVLGLLTGNIRAGAQIKLQRVRLWDTFQTGAFADDHEERDHIAAIARQRGEQALNRELLHDEVLVIGDTPLDIKCGRAINAKVLAVATGGAELDVLKSHQPDWAIPDLTQIDARELLR
jgi:phosphoglycolate phosphatase-like HAD superfamily hydrolase